MVCVNWELCIIGYLFSVSYADVRTCLASDTPGKMEIIPGKTRQNAEAEV